MNWEAITFTDTSRFKYYITVSTINFWTNCDDISWDRKRKSTIRYDGTRRMTELCDSYIGYYADLFREGKLINLGIFVSRDQEEPK